jgi:hypothetical protein
LFDFGGAHGRTFLRAAGDMEVSVPSRLGGLWLALSRTAQIKSINVTVEHKVFLGGRPGVRGLRDSGNASGECLQNCNGSYEKILVVG